MHRVTGVTLVVVVQNANKNVQEMVFATMANVNATLVLKELVVPFQWHAQGWLTIQIGTHTTIPTG